MTGAQEHPRNSAGSVGSAFRLGAALVFAASAVAVRCLGLPLSPLMGVLVYGAGVVAAAFLLSWAAEAAECEISAHLAMMLLALVAVMPESAVDLYFAWRAGSDQVFATYAAANMTGANRLLVGIGWPLVLIVGAFSGRGRTLLLKPVHRLELGWLAVVTVYAALIPLRGRIWLYDGAVLIGLFLAYLWRASHAPSTEPELVGVAYWLGHLGRPIRRVAIAALFLVSAVVIAAVVGPFANALLGAARSMGLSEFLAVQWLAPLASEAPELVVAGTLAARGHRAMAMTALLSSKLNQWTLLVGGLPFACWAGGGGWWLPLDARQTAEFLLTAGQTMLGVALLVNLRLTAVTAAILVGSFVLPFALRSEDQRLTLAIMYLMASAAIMAFRAREVATTIRTLVSGRE